MAEAHKALRSREVAGDAPHVVEFFPTAQCNLACPFCYGPDPRRTDALTPEQLVALFEFLAEEGVRGVTIAGGEPLLSQLLPLALRTAKDLGLWIALHTNATAQKRLAESLPWLDWLCIPLDGLRRDVAMKLRTTRYHPLHFRRAVDAARPSRERGLRLKVGTVVTRANLAELPALAHEVSAVAPNVWKWYQLRPRGQGYGNFSWLNVTSEEIREAETQLRSAYPQLPLTVSMVDDTLAAHLIINPDSELAVPQHEDYACFGRLVKDGGIDREAWRQAVHALDRVAHRDNLAVSFPS